MEEHGIDSGQLPTDGIDETDIYQKPKPEIKVHPQQENLDRLMLAMYNNPEESKPTFWNSKRRQYLYNVSERVFIASIIGGCTLLLLANMWLVLLREIQVVYDVSIVDPNPGSNVSKLIQIKVPFIDSIKYATGAFHFYFTGVISLAIGGLVCYKGMSREYNIRFACYGCGTLCMLIAIYFMILGPLHTILTDNLSNEEILLKKNEYLAYHEHVKGSLKFYFNNQCKNIDEEIMDKDENVAKNMRAFCEHLSRLVIMYYVMWSTTLFPILGLLMNLMQILVNKRYWDMRVPYQYVDETFKPIQEVNGHD